MEKHTGGYIQFAHFAGGGIREFDSTQSLIKTFNDTLIDQGRNAIQVVLGNDDHTNYEIYRTFAMLHGQKIIPEQQWLLALKEQSLEKHLKQIQVNAKTVSPNQNNTWDKKMPKGVQRKWQKKNRITQQKKRRLGWLKEKRR